jgi:hypothetical protein
MQPTACPELVEGAQAVGDEWKTEQAPKGRKKLDPRKIETSRQFHFLPRTVLSYNSSITP